MKTLIYSLKYALTSLLIALMLSFMFVPGNAYAQEVTSTRGTCGDASLLGFPAWYRGLAESNNDSCDIKSPSKVEGGVRAFVLVIIFNVVEMILRAAGYASVAFIIYGGYKYMTSAGSSDGTAAAKKTITNAVIGLVLSIAAVAIVRTISLGLGV